MIYSKCTIPYTWNFVKNRFVLVGPVLKRKTSTYPLQQTSSQWELISDKVQCPFNVWEQDGNYQRKRSEHTKKVNDRTVKRNTASWVDCIIKSVVLHCGWWHYILKWFTYKYRLICPSVQKLPTLYHLFELNSCGENSERWNHWKNFCNQLILLVLIFHQAYYSSQGKITL